jgi:hypothetical protein
MSKGGGGPDLPNSFQTNVQGVGSLRVSQVDEPRTISTNLNLSGPGFAETQSAFPNLLAALRGLREEVRPGFGALTQAGVQAIENNRIRTIGDLKDMLARRKLLGSSFAADTITRANAESAQQEAEFRAQAKLQELDAFNKLLSNESNLIQQQFVNEMRLMGFAGDAAIAMGGILDKNLETLRQSANDEAAGVGSVLGGIAGTVIGAWFGGPAGAAAGFSIGSSLGGAVAGGGSSGGSGGSTPMFIGGGSAGGGSNLQFTNASPATDAQWQALLARS